MQELLSQWGRVEEEVRGLFHVYVGVVSVTGWGFLGLGCGDDVTVAPYKQIHHMAAVIPAPPMLSPASTTRHLQPPPHPAPNQPNA